MLLYCTGRHGFRCRINVNLESYACLEALGMTARQFACPPYVLDQKGMFRERCYLYYAAAQ